MNKTSLFFKEYTLNECVKEHGLNEFLSFCVDHSDEAKNFIHQKKTEFFDRTGFPLSQLMSDQDIIATFMMLEECDIYPKMVFEFASEHCDANEYCFLNHSGGIVKKINPVC